MCYDRLFTLTRTQKKSFDGRLGVALFAVLVSSCSGVKTTSSTKGNPDGAEQRGEVCPDLAQRVQKFELDLPSGLSSPTTNNPSDISYADSAVLRSVSLSAGPNNALYMAWTNTQGSAILTKINAETGKPETNQDFRNILVRDMVATDDGVALLYFYRDGNGSGFGVKKVDHDGKRMFENWNRLVGTFSQLWHLGALAANGDQLAAYFGVSGNQGFNTGHEGDAFKIISGKTGQVVNGGWDWGCSHSIDTRVAWVGSKPVRLCLSDVYPSPGFNIDNAYTIQSTWGTHDGHSGGRIGGFLAMENSLYFAFNKSVGPGYGESTEVMQLQNQAPYTKVKHFTLGTEVRKGMQLAKLARIGTNNLLASWSYAGESAMYVQQLRNDLHFVSKPYRIEGSVGMARSDFQTLPNGDVVWAARDPKAPANKLQLYRAAACK